MQDTVRKEIMPFVFLTCVQTSKFKTAVLSVNLLARLTREAAAKNALLPKVLLRGTKRLPDMERLAAEKNRLYGMRLEPVIRKKGEIHCIGLYADFLDEKYVPGGGALLESAVQFLGEVLLDPVTEDGQLSNAYVESEREKLIDEIQGAVNDKRTYAALRLTELMCGGEDYGTYKLGRVAEAEETTGAGLTKHYAKTLKTSVVEIYYCGGASPQRVEAALLEALEGLPRGEPDYGMGTQVRMNAMDSRPRVFTEEMDVTQGKLAIGFRLGTCMEAPDYAAITLFNYVYGGSVNSKLFLNVREKLSLCYFASSMVERHKGILIVSSGIEFSKYRMALEEILRQLDAIRDGDVTDSEFENAKSALVTDLKTITDVQPQLEDFYLGEAVGEDKICGPMEMAKKAAAVTKEAVIAIAGGVEQDAVYFLKGLTDSEGGGI